MKLATTVLAFFVITYSLSCTITGASTNQGALFPAPVNAPNTIPVTAGDYYQFTVTSVCDVYTFSFCSGGGTAGFDTQISITDLAGTTQLGYNDDFCGLQSELTFSGAPGTYNVLITSYNCNHTSGSTGTLSYMVSTGTAIADYTIYSNASLLNVSGEDCVQLTAAINSQTGCAWNDTEADFSSSFILETQYYFGNNPGGADGTTFTFQNDSPCFCGVGGGEIGVGGITQGLVIEFDTYNNGAAQGDIPADHIAVDVSGGLIDGIVLCGPVSADPLGLSIENGVTHDVRIEWDQPTLTLDIYFDNNLRLSCSNDFVTNTFGGDNMVNWGITGATGGLNNQQYFCPSTTTLPIRLTTFNGQCENDKVNLTWVSESESNSDKYIIEKTNNGIFFQEIGQLKAAGNTAEKTVYTFVDNSPQTTQIYYRLRMIDMDGSEESSEIIKAQACSQDNSIGINYSSGVNASIELVSSKMNQVISLRIYDMNGKVISQENNFSLSSLNTFSVKDLSPGVYLVSVSNESSLVQKRKIVIQ